MSEQNKATMRRFYQEVFDGGNVGLVDEVCAADFIEHEQFPGLSNDREGVKQFVTMLRAAFSDVRMEIQDLIAEGDKVVARIRMSGTQRGEFNGIPPSGRSFSVNTIDIVRLRDGQAVEHWGVTDTASMMEQLRS